MQDTNSTQRNSTNTKSTLLRAKENMQLFVGGLNKKEKVLFFLFVSVIVIFGTTLVFFGLQNKSTNETTLGTPSLFQALQNGLGGAKKLNIDGVETEDFLKTSKDANSNGDKLVTDQKDYQIVYYPSQKSFLISVVSSPFEENRKKAEEEFLTRLNIRQEEACKLKVTITTPYFANPKESGKGYGLSWCK